MFSRRDKSASVSSSAASTSAGSTIAAPGGKEATTANAGTPDSAELEQETEAIAPEDGPEGESDAGKLRQLLSVLKKVVGVKDLANLRLSLPANLLEPQGNLEWWHYLDRPDLFAAIGEKDIDPLTRFIAVVRWTFSKELRYVRGRVCKPYNSALGEQFRCVWEVSPASATEFQVYHDLFDGPPAAGEAPSEFSSAKSSPALSATKGNPLPASMSALSLNDTPVSGSNASPHKRKTSSVAGSSASSIAGAPAAGGAATSGSSGASSSGSCRVAFINEQVCHHPPISAFWYESTGSDSRAGVQATGIDHLAARFNGTSVKIAAGSSNKGIFVKIPSLPTAPEYQITHPGAYITGFLSRAPYVTMADTTYITSSPSTSTSTSAAPASPPQPSSRSTRLSSFEGAPGKQYRAIIVYSEESWITKPRFLTEGVIYEHDGTSATEYPTIKKVPEAAIVARIKGTWRGKITIKRKADKAETTLLDLGQLDIVQKSVRPLEKQDPMETRKFWEPVTNAIVKKDYKQATAHKQTIEQAQRDKAAAREKSGEKFVPVLFDEDISSGQGTLTDAGRKVLKEEFDMVDR